MTERSDRGGPNPLCTRGNQARGSDGVPTRGYSSWARSKCCEPGPDTWLQPRPNARESDCLTTGSRPYMVQIGKRVEKVRIYRITNRKNRTAFRTAGAAASLRT